MTMFSRRFLATTLTAAGLALAGAALTSAPAAAKGGHHGGHHGGGHHGGHRHGGHWGGGWGGGFGYTGYYGAVNFGGVCSVVSRKVFVPGFGFVTKRQTVCG
jgi:hypothetical protein